MSLSTRRATVVLLAASCLAVLALTEGALRLLALAGNPVAAQVARLDPYAVKVEPHGAQGYRQRPGAVFAYPLRRRATANAAGFRGPMVESPKPAGTFRIVLLGESTTHGWGVDDSETIDHYLRQLLQARDSTRRYEVVNLAFDGYDAYQEWQRLLSDGLALEPDAIIVNTGVNDVRNARIAPPLGDPDPRTLIWETEMRRLRNERASGGPALWTRTKHLLFMARVPGFVRGRRARRTPATAAAVETPAYPAAADNFQRNVERIAEVARAGGIPLLLSTPPSVLLAEHPPAGMQPRDYWLKDRAATQAYRDTLAARLTALAARLAAEGQPVHYVPHQLVNTALFLDDCHLTAEGNRAMAADFAAAVTPFIAPHR